MHELPTTVNLIKDCPGDQFEHSQTFFRRMWVSGKMRNSCPKKQHSLFMTRMFHCFYNNTDYGESQAGGQAAGYSGPLRVI